MNAKLYYHVWIFIVTKMTCLASHCRSKLGVYQPEDFKFHACVWCYFFLYPEYVLKPDAHYHFLAMATNSSKIMIKADVSNDTSVKLICSTLTSYECDNWKMCCESSRDCCQRQQHARDGDVNGTCPPTWDGFGCWDGGTPGENSHLSCPNFLQFAIPTKSAIKTCMSDGSWFKKGNYDWTDYTPCLSYDELKTTIYISVGCQIASLVCLVPSVLIFCYFRSLLHQKRIRLHLNFFLSFIMSGTCIILWNTLVTFDRITNVQVTDTVMYNNKVECKLLSFLKLYFISTNYAWMFCEGFYLYRLIVNAFSPPKGLLLFYLLGWGIPLISTIIYAIIRIASADESCWAISIGNKEWILYTPNLFCLVANLYFLCTILRILLTQLQVHPNEPSSFRKALKATFVLIPLFGVQLVVTIYRIPPESPGALHYERFSEIVNNTQGLCVAVIFCLCNGEVVSLIKRLWIRRQTTKYVGSRKENISMNNTLTSKYNSMMDRGSPSKRHLILCYKRGCAETTSI